ncbi:energy-coupling factor transporter transmembrane component T family protein [Tengunoibacter tsumagoiensis]|uniref:Energy-coupling factor transporter transmembrane protein EcfT n=1 Tax=Tengunoibacter tsumagoiensis TaxID=2014871 RepID=A0A402A1F2_9CHLR|nr:energy-coupling factor transporter transmembrane component T [Tengunoibacter tsumagoiensis]GCE12990.1 hypothetical protein KTT_28490 [Tengunoibacter tsumagoiensis]
MLKNISIGIYYPGKSLLHRLQARTKLISIFWMVGILFIANHRIWHFAPYLIVGGLALAGILLSGITLREIWHRVWFLIAMTLTSALFAIFNQQGDERVFTRLGPWQVLPSLAISILLSSCGVICLLFLSSFLRPLGASLSSTVISLARSFLVFMLLVSVLVLVGIVLLAGSKALPVGPVIITYGSVWALVTSFAVFLELYLFSLLLTMTTLPVALIEATTWLLYPLRRLHLPVDDFALMALLALRFIPTLFEEAEQLIKAQSARGADITEGSLFERMRCLAMFFVPLIHGTLRRASELSVALEARGYQSEGQQTRLHEQNLHWIDYLTLGVIAAITLGSLFL